MKLKPSMQAAIASGLAFVAIMLWKLPDIFRVRMVSSMGVVDADRIRFMTLAVGIPCGLVAIGFAAIATIQVMAEHRAATDAKDEQERWDDLLPKRNETDPRVIADALEVVVNRYGSAVPYLVSVQQQVEAINGSFADIGKIIRANPGMTGDANKPYDSVELLGDGVRRQISPKLLGIVYQAKVLRHDVNRLKRTVKQAHDEIQPFVDRAQELASAVAESATRGDNSAISSALDAAITQLKATTPKGQLSL